MSPRTAAGSIKAKVFLNDPCKRADFFQKLPHSALGA